MGKSKSFDNYKTKECKVLGYLKANKTLLINFDGFGISLITDEIDSLTVKIKYFGKIGTKDFKYELIG